MRLRIYLGCDGDARQTIHWSKTRLLAKLSNQPPSLTCHTKLHRVQHHLPGQQPTHACCVSLAVLTPLLKAVPLHLCHLNACNPGAPPIITCWRYSSHIPVLAGPACVQRRCAGLRTVTFTLEQTVSALVYAAYSRRCAARFRRASQIGMHYRTNPYDELASAMPRRKRIPERIRACRAQPYTRSVARSLETKAGLGSQPASKVCTPGSQARRSCTQAAGLH